MAGKHYRLSGPKINDKGSKNIIIAAATMEGVASAWGGCSEITAGHSFVVQVFIGIRRIPLPTSKSITIKNRS
jgi:hypothetical protein